MLGLGKVPGNPLTFPLPPNEGSKDTQAQGTQTATEMDICKIRASCTNDPSALCFPPQPLGDEGEGWKGREQLTWSAHLPGLCLQGPGWPQSPPATCPQLCDGWGHL